MAKIWRRKKGGKEVGALYVTVRGKPVNLKTKDAREGNKRARLALRGEWPDGSAAAAAKAAAPLENAERQEDSSPAEAEGGGKSPAATPGTVPSRPPAAETPPPPAAADEPDPLAAAAAAAADAAGAPVGDTSAPEQDEQARRAEWGRAFSQRYGGFVMGGQPGMSPGVLAAMAQWKAISAVAARKAAARKMVIAVDAKSVETMVEVLGFAWDEQLRRWGMDLSTVEPWMIMLAVPVAMMGVCVAGTTTPEKAAAAAAGEQPSPPAADAVP